MGWTVGKLDGQFTSRAAIEFDLGPDFARRIIDTARYGSVVYAAIRSVDGAQVFGLVLLTERRDGLLSTKPVSEDMGPAEDACPARILDLLTEPTNEYAREWRERCRARLARGRPRRGQLVTFASPLKFTDGSEHKSLTYLSGSRFRDPDGRQYHVQSWSRLDFQIGAVGPPPSTGKGEGR
jgi:hypothetical protein